MNEELLQQTIYNMIKKGMEKEKVSVDFVFKKYILYSEQMCRPETIKYYQKMLYQFSKLLQQYNITFCQDIQQTYIDLYIRSEQARGISNATLNKVIGSAKQAFTHACRINLIAINPLSQFKKLPEKTPKTEIIEIKYIKSILNYLKMKDIDEDLFWLRNNLIFNLLMDSAIRRNEMLNIIVKHINFDTNTIYLEYTKNKEPRYAHFSDYTKSLLIRYIDHFHPTNYLFINIQTRQRITPKFIYKIIEIIKKDLQIPESVSISPHKWRHSNATLLYKETKDIRLVQEHLGHLDIQMTMRYTHIDNDELRTTVVQSKVLNDLRSE